MLGRTADQLYWIARYTDRAENMARLLDVSHRMSITLPPGPAQLSRGDRRSRSPATTASTRSATARSRAPT